ncbi:MAG: DAK2 domain-containing protein [Jatrophihabitans sp.]|nr:MAG: DAK2 domain-containing protein [Jatrophihabitans sp.]
MLRPRPVREGVPVRDRPLVGLDGDAVRAWLQDALAALDAAREEIDALNVFPVPDSDTGTNLCLTVRAAVEAGSRSPDARGALAELARAAVLGARGNSGVILAQLLRGLAEAAPAAVVVGPGELRAGLAHGADLAYDAVAAPVEGTVLTVARAAAEACAGDSLAEASGSALVAAQAALERTPQQLVALRRAGVVDAGGQGLVLVLDSLARTVTGDHRARPTVRARVSCEPAARDGTFPYEVQYLLEAPEPAAVALRGALAALGDSVIVAGTGDGTWNVHVHVEDVGAAIEAAVAAGPTRNISVVRFADQTRPDDPAAAAPASTVVAVVEGAGLARLFGREGIVVVDAAGRDAAGRIVGAATGNNARQVVLLPNDPRASAATDAAAAQLRAAGVRVVIVPSRSPVQGLAAVAVHDRSRPFDDDVVAMAEAAGATRYAQVRVADGAALTSVGMCRRADVLGLIDGDVVQIGADVGAVACDLVDRLLGVGAELVTVLLGETAPSGLDVVITDRVRAHTALTEVSVFRAGMPDSPVILGVE